MSLVCCVKWCLVWAGDAAANERPEPEAQHARHVGDDHQLLFGGQEAGEIQSVVQAEIVVGGWRGASVQPLDCCSFYSAISFPFVHLSYLVHFSPQ